MKSKKTSSNKKTLSNVFVYLMIFASILLVSAFSVSATATFVDLGAASNFAVLSKAQITDVPSSVITGDVGASPIKGASIHLTCLEVTGTIYAVDAAGPSSCSIENATLLTAAVHDMLTAYNSAVDVTANPAGTGAFLNVNGGTLGVLGTSQIFVPGVYTWTTGVTIPNDIYINGSSTDVWVFQIAGTLDISSSTQVHLIGGALAKNVFWAVSGTATLGTGSVFEGNILTTGTSHIAMLTGATLHGRALSDGEVWLQSSTITMPSSGPVSPVLTTITLLPTTKNITVGSETQLNATSLDQFGAPFAATISFNSSNPSVATVNSTSGLVTAVSAGNTTIFAANGTITATSIIFVKALPVLTTIKLLPASANLTLGATKQLNITTLDQYNVSIAAAINYTSNDTAIATVSSSGLVTAVASGGALITATSGSLNATSMINVQTDPPILNRISYLFGLRSVTQGTLLNFTITATSPSGQPLTFNMSGIPATANLTDNHDGTAAFNWVPNSSNVGSYNVNFTVTDGIKSASEIVAIKVNALPAPITTSENSIVDLGTAGNFVILTKTGISTTGITKINGNIGVSPAAATYITGFGLIMSTNNTFSTSSVVNGSVYAADYTPPTPSTMTTAVSDMETAYIDAAGRTNPDATELGAGDISGMTLYSGLYKWSTGVLINTGVTLDCQNNTNAVFIFQIAQDLTVGNGAIITLSGGCQAQNIFWQVAGQTTLGTTSNFKGNILDQTAIILNTGATLNGRALAQTAVTLDANNVTIVPVASLWSSNGYYNFTLSTTGHNNATVAYINYSLNNISGHIIGNFGNVLLNASRNNTLIFYAVDASGDVESPTTISTAPIINSFALSATSVNIGDAITGACAATDTLGPNPDTVITGIDTSTSGAKTATCTATDLAGNVVTSFASYTVNAAPTPAPAQSNGGSNGGGSSSGGTSLQCGSWSTCDATGMQTTTCTLVGGNTTITRTQSCVANPADTTPITTNQSTTASGTTGSANNGQNSGTTDQNNNGAAQSGGNQITGGVVAEPASSNIWTGIAYVWNSFINWITHIFG